jgi:hypothetical protein
MSTFVFRKLREARIWRRIVRERLAEPLLLNLASLFVAAFGSFRAKVEFDLIIRMNHAWGLLYAADQARVLGIDELTCIEFGVAGGAGLLNLCEIADRVTRETGVKFQIIGFDTGKGMPRPTDHRDHPEHYRECDYPMFDQKRLIQRLPPQARLILGNVRETVSKFVVAPHPPVGFVSFDLDYHSSTVDALQALRGSPESLLPWTVLYFDDTQFITHNEFQGVFLAIKEFNEENSDRKIAPVNQLELYRWFRRAAWLKCMYLLHVFEHPYRTKCLMAKGTAVLTNPYLK